MIDLKSNLTVPNILSLMRIIILLPFAIFVVREDYIKAGLILILSGLTDLFDGYIARKFNQVTKIGKMLDPTADKLTLMAVMICVSLKFPSVLPFMIILIIKEVSMLVAGAFLLKKKKNPPSSKWYGKFSTFMFYVSITAIIGAKAVWNIDIEFLNIFLMSMTSICMLYSLWRYFNIFVSIIKEA